MSKRTLFLIFALFLITGVLLTLAIYQPQAPKVQPTAITPTKEPVAQTILSFDKIEIATPSSTTTLNYSLPIKISSGKNKITAVQLEIQYDPMVLENVKIKPANFFKSPIELLNQIDSKSGRITYALGAGLNEATPIGQDNVATITFSTKLNLQKTALIFLPKTLVTAEGINESVLKEANLIQLTVGKAISTPSAAPSL